MLAVKVAVNNRQTLEMHKSGLELRRRLKYHVDRASAFNVISILKRIRHMQEAKNRQDVMSKVNSLEKRHQEYHRQVVGSKRARVREEDAWHQCRPRGVQENRLGESAS